jgi:pimeloyl-ACP methyl ester carboxylesterase
LCFHGYGEEAGSFSFLEKYAGGQFTFFALDLPFHGQTEWKNGLNIGANDLKEIIVRILVENHQQVSGSRKLYLMGFSLGGRIALKLYEEMPGRIQKLILLAPDGLKVNFWYWLATQTWAGNKLFALTMKYPGWFFGFLKLLNALKLVNASIFKFVNHYIGDPEVRKLLYERWTGLRKIRPDLDKIKTLLRANRTQTRLVYGKHDRIILPVRGEKFIRGIEDISTLSVIHSGHQVLHENHIHELLPALLH